MLFISVYSKMELTEFDVRLCYAPKLGAKLQQIFEIYKFFFYLQGNTGINTNINRTITKNPRSVVNDGG